jgi:lipoyl(octanoyl) transferase
MAVSVNLDAQAAFRDRLTMLPWALRTDAATTGGFNMLTDSSLLLCAAREVAGPTLRFYSWNPPAVSLGRFQKVDGINLEALKRRGWDLIGRSTGGRAVLHQHEVTYCIVLPPSVVGNAGVRTSHAALTELLNDGLRRLLPKSTELIPPPLCEARTNRTPNCFALTGECDIVTSAGKLVGSAQARHEGALLQHGSILLDADREAWTELFGECGSLVTLRELLGRAVDPGEVHQALIEEFQDRRIVLTSA